MQKKELIAKINSEKTADGKKMSVEKLGERFSKTKQTMYNYIEYYVNEEYGKINDERVLNELHRIAGKSAEDDITPEFSEKKELLMAISILKETIGDINEAYPFKEDSNESRFTDRPEMENYYNELESRLKEYKQQLIDRFAEQEFNEPDKSEEIVIEPVNRLINREMRKGGRGGPEWNPSERALNTLCLSDNNGNYMVIVDEILENKGYAELELYALIGGRKTHIGTYKFKEGEAFVRLNLIPRLSYFYDVWYFSNDEYHSGIQELKNYA